MYNDITSIEERMEERGFIDSILKDNQWCPSNVRATLLHEVEGGNRRIRRFFSVGCPFAETMGLPGLLTLWILGNR